MRVSVKKALEPVTIVLETQEEIDIMYALFNYNPIADALGLEEKPGWFDDGGLYETLHGARSTDYEKYHNLLEGGNFL